MHAKVMHMQRWAISWHLLQDSLLSSFFSTKIRINTNLFHASFLLT